MFINGRSLLNAAPILGMVTEKMNIHGTSYGLAEAGYDIRIREKIVFTAGVNHPRVVSSMPDGSNTKGNPGRFILASAIERFQMPYNLVGTVRDKSTWARKGLSVFNTVIEPGWNGILTLELVFNGNENLIIEAGSGIAQVLFGELSDYGNYGHGKYQNATDISRHQLHRVFGFQIEAS